MVRWAKDFTLIFPTHCGERYLGFMWAALDESTDRERKYTFVVAGYLGRQNHWANAQRKWMRRLAEDGLKYFSTNECMFLSGEFKKFRDNEKYPKPLGRLAANKIRDDLYNIMCDEYVAGYALGVRMKEWKAIRKSARARKILHADPYIHMYTMMMVLITGDLEDEHLAGRLSTREGVAFLCDEHDKGIKIKNAYNDLMRFNPSCAPWMGSLSYMDNEQSPALQAADLLAARCKDGLVEEATKSLSTQQLGEMLRNRFLSRFRYTKSQNVG